MAPRWLQTLFGGLFLGALAAGAICEVYQAAGPLWAQIAGSAFGLGVTVLVSAASKPEKANG